MVELATLKFPPTPMAAVPSLPLEPLSVPDEAVGTRLAVMVAPPGAVIVSVDGVVTENA